MCVCVCARAFSHRSATEQRSIFDGQPRTALTKGRRVCACAPLRRSYDKMTSQPPGKIVCESWLPSCKQPREGLQMTNIYLCRVRSFRRLRWMPVLLSSLSMTLTHRTHCALRFSATTDRHVWRHNHWHVTVMYRVIFFHLFVVINYKAT